ncbi:diguanylate cyclase [Chitinimonas sp. BJYL2]|uniref:GGDEF domain-containing protein n=1 Tax=Chitinimonas sp. BJYL2 TaxID=2976696 RepID=UPI0022B364AC|nr:GGDEF domain-containing protein [Chitinimonas sp. BJYL2]
MRLPDLATLILAESLMLLQLAALVFVTGRRVRGVLDGPLLWSLGLLAFALTQFCVSLEWNGVRHIGLLTDVLAATGSALFVTGMHDFAGRPRDWRPVGGLWLANGLLFGLSHQFLPTDYARPLVFGLIQLAYGYLLIRALRIPVRPQERLGIQLLKALAWSWCLVNAYRLVVRLAYAPSGSGFEMRELVFYVLVLFFGIWLALGVLLLIHERIAADLSFATRLDPLTQALNRRGFAEALRTENRRLIRNWVPTSLLAIDIDHFKQINDRFGHAIGDKALQQFAQLVREELREVDVFARLGGEEFAIVLMHAPMEGAHVVAERLRKRAEDLVLQSAAGPVWFTISIGIASLGRHECELEPLLGEADKALYAAKQAGRNRVIAATVLTPVPA